jgi:hypothetical protein
MWRLAALMWILTGTVLAGVAVMVIVSVPQLNDLGMKLIPVGAIAGFVVALPISWVLARHIDHPTQHPAT